MERVVGKRVLGLVGMEWLDRTERILGHQRMVGDQWI
jgi:hypothetical protein